MRTREIRAEVDARRPTFVDPHAAENTVEFFTLLAKPSSQSRPGETAEVAPSGRLDLKRHEKPQ
jgi:hypothetical protein